MSARLLLVIVLALVVSIMPAPAHAVPDGGIELVDRLSGFGPLSFDGVNEADVDHHSLSANGCFVAITSDNDVLSPFDDDAESDVFRVDRCSPGRPTVLASATAAGVPGNGTSFSPTISADGRYVAFTTNARNLLPPGTTVGHAIAVKDLQTGALVVGSRGDGAAGAVADAFRGVISGDGSALAFEARGAVVAQNATGVANQDDVYVRYLGSNATRMASVTSGGLRGGADGGFDISHDGTAVALVTQSGLVAGDSDGGRDAYLIRNVATAPAVGWISFTVGNETGANSASQVVLSGDKARAAYSNDRVWTTTLGTCAPCPDADPVDGAAPGTPPSIFGLGFPAGVSTHVFWNTDRAVLASDTDGESDLYVRDLSQLGSDAGLAMPLADVPGPALAGDVKLAPGPVTVFNANSTLLPGTDGVRSQVFARAAGQDVLLSQPAGLPAQRGETYDTSLDRLHGVSEGGRFVVMTSASPGLGAQIRGTFWDSFVLVRDLATGTTTNVSVAPGGALADSDAQRPSIDAAGSRVAFTSQATDLVAEPTGGDTHVYVRDLATGTTQLLDRGTGGSPSSGGAGNPVISGDGTKVVFESGSPDLPDADGSDHVYLADLETGELTLVDRDPAGVIGNSSARSGDPSTDGSRVAFISSASNLGAGVNGKPRVYVKDLQTGAIFWASVPEDLDPQKQATQLVTLSGDGRRVAWVDATPDFGYGSDGRPHVYVRDLAAGTTTLASVGGSGDPTAEQGDPALDADGSHLLFLESVPGVRRSPYLRDLAAGTTTPLLPGRRFGAFRATISPDGRCIALNSKSPDVLASGNPSPDFDHVYMTAVGADCPVVPAGPGGGPGPGGGGADTTAPVLSDVRMTRRRFAVARKRTPRVAAKRGSAFRFTLSEDARTSIAIARARPGRRVGGRCVKPTRKRRSRPRCRRHVVRATLTRAGTVQGPNRVGFSGRIGRRKLARGRYRATLAAADAAGNRSERAHARFRIVRR